MFVPLQLEDGMYIKESCSALSPIHVLPAGPFVNSHDPRSPLMQLIDALKSHLVNNEFVVLLCIRVCQVCFSFYILNAILIQIRKIGPGKTW